MFFLRPSDVLSLCASISSGQQHIYRMTHMPGYLCIQEDTLCSRWTDSLFFRWSQFSLKYLAHLPKISFSSLKIYIKVHNTVGNVDDQSVAFSFLFGLDISLVILPSHQKKKNRRRKKEKRKISPSATPLLRASNWSEGHCEMVARISRNIGL